MWSPLTVPQFLGLRETPLPCLGRRSSEITAVLCYDPQQAARSADQAEASVFLFLFLVSGFRYAAGSALHLLSEIEMWTSVSQSHQK